MYSLVDVIAKLLARTSRAVKTRLHLLMQAKWTTFVQKALESCPNRSGTIEDVCDRVYDHMLPALTGLGASSSAVCETVAEIQKGDHTQYMRDMQ